jgi:biopolymer transport protein ExbD
MRFAPPRRRGPPSVIIVSLIDVLIVVLIFMMVATTFKQQPALRLALPESSQTQRTAVDLDQLVITIGKEAPHLYLGELPITLERLREELRKAAQRGPRVSLSIRADQEAPFGQIIRVMDAAKESGIKAVNAFTRPTGAR